MTNDEGFITRRFSSSLCNAHLFDFVRHYVSRPPRFGKFFRVETNAAQEKNI
jgi:hypothetical protein